MYEYLGHRVAFENPLTRACSVPIYSRPISISIIAYTVQCTLYSVQAKTLTFAIIAKSKP